MKQYSNPSVEGPIEDIRNIMSFAAQIILISKSPATDHYIFQYTLNNASLRCRYPVSHSKLL